MTSDEEAVEIVLREGRGSVSLLQRNLQIGYGRAARLIDFMAEDGIVGTYKGSKAREVLMTLSDWEASRHEGPPVTRNEAVVAAPAWSSTDHDNSASETDFHDVDGEGVHDQPGHFEVRDSREDDQAEDDETDLDEAGEVADEEYEGELLTVGFG